MRIEQIRKLISSASRHSGLSMQHNTANQLCNTAFIADVQHRYTYVYIAIIDAAHRYKSCNLVTLMSLVEDQGYTLKWFFLCTTYLDSVVINSIHLIIGNIMRSTC